MAAPGQTSRRGILNSSESEVRAAQTRPKAAPRPVTGRHSLRPSAQRHGYRPEEHWRAHL
jgi:hypothetical protein